jgi:hypothetical protein
MRVRCGMEQLRAGHLTDAHADFTRAREAAHAHRSAQIVALADVGLGELARVAGDLAEARTRLTGALARLDRVRGLPSHVVEVPALTGLGRVAVAAGDLADARARLGAGLRLALCAADGPSVAVVAEAVAELAVAEADYGEAARLLGLAAAARGASDRGSPDVACTESAARAALAGSFDAVYTAAAGLGAAGAAAALSTLDL